MTANSNISWLQKWISQSDTAYPDNTYSINIKVISNPGWSIEFDFRDFKYNFLDFLFNEWNIDENNWLSVVKDDHTITLYCGPLLLDQAIGQLRSFIEHNEMQKR
jgi:hypothetical protein